MMAKAVVHVDISDDVDLLQLAQEVQAMNEPRVLRHEGADLAILAPVKRRRRSSGKATSADDTLWNIVGMGSSEGPTDVSGNKYEYLSDAYESKGQ